jgi:D-alanine-D-alanine ligase
MEGRFNAEDFETVNRLKAALATLSDYRFSYLDNHGSLIARLRAERPAFVLNLCDEGYNNDAFLELHVPALLEMLGIPYSGAGPTCLGMCYDKSLVRSVAMTFDVPVPLETVCDIGDQSATMPSVFPALIKPNCGDSSIGITKDAVVYNPEEAIAYLSRLRELVPGRAALVQEYLPGTEYSVGLVGNPGLGIRVLPILEVDYSRLDPSLPQILSYESKWDPASPYWTQIRYREARADDEARRRMVDNAITLFERLACRDYARFDFRTDAAGEIKLLEVNPNPGWCWDGKMNFMAEFAGHTYADLLRWIIEAAQARVAAGRAAAPAQPALAMAAGQ